MRKPFYKRDYWYLGSETADPTIIKFSWWSVLGIFANFFRNIVGAFTDFFGAWVQLAYAAANYKISRAEMQDQALAEINKITNPRNNEPVIREVRQITPEEWMKFFETQDDKEDE
ncbi:MAG: hypothetical protein ACKO0Z_13095 [Betaproteobacteria bacterium]